MIGLTAQQDIRWPTKEPTYEIYQDKLYDYYDWGELLGRATRTEEGRRPYYEGPK